MQKFTKGLHIFKSFGIELWLIFKSFHLRKKDKVKGSYTGRVGLVVSEGCVCVSKHNLRWGQKHIFSAL